MPQRPVIIGLETEFGILARNSGYTDLISAPYDVVMAIKECWIPFIDRGLEVVEDIREHEEAEEQAQMFFNNRHSQHERIFVLRSQALRQRLGYSGFFLANGARYYVDMGHPEYSTPETESPFTAMVVQKAGDLIVERCRKHAQDLLGKRTKNNNVTIHIYRNNSDGKGHSYAGHENYSLSPKIFDEIMERKSYVSRHSFISPLAHMVLKFLITRSIIIGSGKVGFEGHSPAPYQISQRADFMLRAISHSTVQNRGIINTRNDPLARRTLARRFHTICGDSNMSELSIYLKGGITALFFKMLEQGYIQSFGENLTTALDDPVRAMHAVSRDLTLRQALPLVDGTSRTALDTQMQYNELAKSFVDNMGLGSLWIDVVNKWQAVLNGLDQNRFADPWASSLDWVAKERCLKQYQKQHDIIDPLDLRCKSLALAYHDINPDHSLYDRLVNNGKILRIADQEEITRMASQPPIDTRAYLRGTLITRYPDILDIGWDYVISSNGNMLNIDHPRKGTKEHIDPLLADNPSLDMFLQRLKNLFAPQRKKTSMNSLSSSDTQTKP